MLVIKRKQSESILIGDDIEVIVSEIYPDKVKICIDAPKDIIISRKELVETCEFNISASKNICKYDIESIKEKLKKKK